MENKIAGTLEFLRPLHLIKSKGLTKKDVRNIKDNLVNSSNIINFFVSLVLFALVGGLFIFMSNTTGNFILKYGLFSFIGFISVIVACSTNIILTITAFIIKNKRVSSLLKRIGGDILFIVASIYMLFCFYSDAQMGFTTAEEALSASIVFIAILLLIQPMHWIDAIIGDIGTSIGIVVVALYCSKVFGMKASHYYFLVAVVFPFAGYVIVSLLFYAEVQRYKEVLENERLHNRAYYDSLTHCKNRHALNEFLKENKSRWENKDNVNLLIVLFDIDDFRLYNNQFSHLGGDYCLKSICDAIRRKFVSPNLDFFRYGGEEFLLFFELNNPEEAKVYLENVRLAISSLDIVAPQGAPKNNVTISVGGLLMNNITTFSFEEEMKIVDGYLYKAKESGKDVVCFNGSIIK